MYSRLRGRVQPTNVTFFATGLLSSEEGTTQMIFKKIDMKMAHVKASSWP